MTVMMGDMILSEIMIKKSGYLLNLVKHNILKRRIIIDKTIVSDEIYDWGIILIKRNATNIMNLSTDIDVLKTIIKTIKFYQLYDWSTTVNLKYKSFYYFIIKFLYI